MQALSVLPTIHHSMRHLSCLLALDTRMQSCQTALISELCQRREPCSFKAPCHKRGNLQSPGCWILISICMSVPHGHSSRLAGRLGGAGTAWAPLTLCPLPQHWCGLCRSAMILKHLKICLHGIFQTSNWSLGISTLSSILKHEILSPEFEVMTFSHFLIFVGGWQERIKA